jgi:hypothetical protein
MCDWITIYENLPPLGVDVVFACFLEDQKVWYGPYIGKWIGTYTAGHTLVMDYGEDDDWYSCSHWFPIPPFPN